MQELLLNLKVTPNSKEFAISGFDEKSSFLRIRTKAKAVEGKANIEATRMLEKLLGCKVKIVSGLKSRNKKIVLEKSQKVLEFLKNL